MDTEFRELEITEVNGLKIVTDDGWSFMVPESTTIVPKVGMSVRFYGKGLGYPVRGLEINGVTIFYRTVEEQKNYQNELSYGKSSQDWLNRWDSGDSVWSIEMGGLGPGYEQCIHITAAEILRVMLDKQYDTSTWDKYWKEISNEIENTVLKVPRVEKLGLSGAQWGAAMNLATMLYMHGPIKALTDERIKDRLIQVSKFFPG